jgi:translation initiation factor 2B subunit (eIF-2B alpha/beta/delta family)
MEIAAILQLIKDYGLANVVIVGAFIYFLKGKIDGIGQQVKHVDEAVNNREPNELTLSQEVRVIRRELSDFKAESIKILKDFNQLRKEGYLVAAELKADVEHANANVKQASKATAQLVREIKREVEHIRQEVDLHREVDEKAFEQIRDDIHKIASK